VIKGVEVRTLEHEWRLTRMAVACCAAFAPFDGPMAAAAWRRQAMTTWTTERIGQLRSFVGAGLTCSQIAVEIGVTRNAVIGKIHRLGLGPGRAATVQERYRPARVSRPRVRTQHWLLRLIRDAPSIAGDATLAAMPIESAHPCSLLELAPGKCRWPLSDPSGPNFAFCGNDQAAGFSYCAGHARMAYRPNARR
jgi:GcrA cell cycle regulator